MNYWWVSQNQTFRQEIGGGYMWSPKTDKNGKAVPSYRNMTLVQPGDVVVAFYQQKIQSAGLVVSAAVEAPKPAEFGSSGEMWADSGWLVEVAWQDVPNPFSPKDHMATLEPLLPEKHSPIRSSGTGNQAYLFQLGGSLAKAVIEIAQVDFSKLQSELLLHESAQTVLKLIEGFTDTQNDTSIERTIRLARVKARIGQDRFKSNLMKIESGCRITGIKNPRFLIASHIKPWASCETDAERIDGNNGLLLTPNCDRLFDGGFISFASNGDMLVSGDIHPSDLELLSIPTAINVGSFNSQQEQYLAYHRSFVFKDS